MLTIETLNARRASLVADKEKVDAAKQQNTNLSYALSGAIQVVDGLIAEETAAQEKEAARLAAIAAENQAHLDKKPNGIAEMPGRTP